MLPRILVLLCLLPHFGVAATPHGFSLAGWGFDRSLPVTFPGPLHPKVLLGGGTGSGPLLLVGAGGILYAVDPKAKAPIQPRAIASFDAEVPPSAAFGPEGCAVALLGLSGWELHLVSPGQAPVRLARLTTPFRFGVSVSWVGPEIWVASAIQVQDRFSSKLTRYARIGGVWSGTDLALPGPTDEKGFFFHTVCQTRKGTSIYFVSRAPSVQDASLRDSLCVLPVDGENQVRPEALFKMPTAGLVYHQPSLLRLPRVDLLLYSSKKVATYGLQLFAIDEGVELSPGPSVLNLVDPQAVIRGNRVEIFALATKGPESRIVRLEMDGDRLFQPGYLDQVRPVPATRPDLPVRALAAAPSGDESWQIFFTAQGLDTIQVCGPDRETDPPEVELIFRKDTAKKLAWPDMTWSAPEEPSGLAGYAYLLDRKADSVPRLMNLGPTERLVSASGLPPGTYWFHLAAIDAFRNVSPVVHRKFEVVDLSPPPVAVVTPRTATPTPILRNNPDPVTSAAGEAKLQARVAPPPSPSTLRIGTAMTPGSIRLPGDPTNQTNRMSAADAFLNSPEFQMLQEFQTRSNYFRYLRDAEQEMAKGNLKISRESCNQALLLRPDGFEVGVLLSALEDRENHIFGGRLPWTVSIIGLLLCVISFFVYRRVLGQ